jgi:hypothetical protein
MLPEMSPLSSGVTASLAYNAKANEVPKALAGVETFPARCSTKLKASPNCAAWK